MGVVVIKYNAGNVFSVTASLHRIGVSAEVSDDPAVIRSASHVIFPGVGEAASAMEYLCSRGLDNVLRSVTSPLLGICLGMQLLLSTSEEGNAKTLGIIEGRVQKFPESTGMKIPHIGWNRVEHTGEFLFKGISENAYFYFVHSYFAPLSSFTTGKTEYGVPFTSALQKKNYFGVQFHPEKSGKAGESLLKNFLELS